MHQPYSWIFGAPKTIEHAHHALCARLTPIASCSTNIWHRGASLFASHNEPGTPLPGAAIGHRISTEYAS